MPDFKKLLEEEIDTVFLDDDIFAEERDINGKPMKVVICDDTLKEASGHWEGGVRRATVRQSTLRTKAIRQEKDFGRRPKLATRHGG